MAWSRQTTPNERKSLLLFLTHSFVPRSFTLWRMVTMTTPRWMSPTTPTLRCERKSRVQMGSRVEEKEVGRRAAAGRWLDEKLSIDVTVRGLCWELHWLFMYNLFGAASRLSSLFFRCLSIKRRPRRKKRSRTLISDWQRWRGGVFLETDDVEHRGKWKMTGVEEKEKKEYKMYLVERANKWEEGEVKVWSLSDRCQIRVEEWG